MIVYLTLRQQQDCGGGESKTTDRIGMVRVVHVEEMKMGRGLGEKQSGVGGIDNNGYMMVYVGRREEGSGVLSGYYLSPVPPKAIYMT